MKGRIKKREYLQKCLKTYEDTFNIHNAMYEELMKNKKEICRKKDNVSAVITLFTRVY